MLLVVNLCEYKQYKRFRLHIRQFDILVQHGSIFVRSDIFSSRFGNLENKRSILAFAPMSISRFRCTGLQMCMTKAPDEFVWRPASLVSPIEDRLDYIQNINVILTILNEHYRSVPVKITQNVGQTTELYCCSYQSAINLSFLTYRSTVILTDNSRTVCSLFTK